VSHIDFTPQPLQQRGSLQQPGNPPLAGFAPPPPRGGRGGGGGGRRGTLLGLGALAVVGVTAGALLTGAVDVPWNGEAGRQASYLVTPTGQVAKTACVDSSASVDKEGRLASMASTAIIAAVDGLPAWPETPHTWEPTPATPATTLSARVVRRNSYSTRDGGRYVATAEVGAVHGLSESKPGADTPDASAGWADDAVTVGKEATAANTAMKRARSELEKVLSRHSNGSDVIGCVGAALEATRPGTTVDLLVVSDLQDRTLKNPDGSTRAFRGDFSGARVLVVQACPSGDQARCLKTGRAFTQRLAELGVTDVQTFRPEELDSGVDAWLAPRP
jgi:hypothetical protein